MTFDTNKPNEELQVEIQELMTAINTLLSRNIMDSLPQIYIDPDKKPKISIIPIKPEDEY